MSEYDKYSSIMQQKVARLVDDFHLEISPELRYIDLTSEMGEFGKELLKGTNYGRSAFVMNDDVVLEFGDALFSLICVANSLNIDIESALDAVINKYRSRFSKSGDVGSGF